METTLVNSKSHAKHPSQRAKMIAGALLGANGFKAKPGAYYHKMKEVDMDELRDRKAGDKLW
jgi:hypothetical protein